MRKTLVVLALALLPTSALAQYTSPGYGAPPPTGTITAGNIDDSLNAGITVTGSAETILFKLDGASAATQTFLSFTNVATPTRNTVFNTGTTSSVANLIVTNISRIASMELNAASGAGNLRARFNVTDGSNSGVLTVDDGTSSFVQTGNVGASTGTLSIGASVFGVSFTGSGIGTPLLDLQDSAANTFLSFTNVATPANVITFAQDSSVPSQTTTVTSGVTGTVTQVVDATAGTPSMTTTVTDGTALANVSLGSNSASMSASDGATQSSIAVLPTEASLAVNSGVVNTTAILSLQDIPANDFLRFINVADSNKTITVAQDSSGPSQTTTVTNGTNTVQVTLDANSPSGIISVNGATSGGQTTVTDNSVSFVTTSGSNSVTQTAESLTPSLTTTVTDGVDTGEFSIVPKGVKMSALAVSPSQEWASLVQGGFTLDGTLVADPASTVTVTVVDTTPGIVDGDVQVCGYEDVTNQTNLLKTCETIDFSGGAAALATTATFIEVTNIKASSFSVLGGGGDETIAAAFTTGAVSILAAVNLTNATKSVFTASLSGDSWNYQAVTCLDLQGCDLTLGEDVPPVAGHELLLALQTATTAIVFVDVDAQMEMAGDANDTLNALDVIKFIYSGGAWLQVSLSEN